MYSNTIGRKEHLNSEKKLIWISFLKKKNRSVVSTQINILLSNINIVNGILIYLLTTEFCIHNLFNYNS